MIQEIPYGVYNDTESKDIELPISIEVIPHKAIVIYDANPLVINRPSRCHICVVIFFGCVPISAFILIILSFTSQNVHDALY